MAENFSFGTALKIIFTYIQAPPAVLAERYVDRDRTLVYKWLRDAAFPPKKLFPDIIRFVTEQSGEPARVLIKTEMDRYLSDSGMDARVKVMLNEDSDFKDYLECVFSLLAAEKTLGKKRKQTESAQSQSERQAERQPDNDQRKLSGTQTEFRLERQPGRDMERQPERGLDFIRFDENPGRQSARLPERQPDDAMPDERPETPPRQLYAPDERAIHIRLTRSTAKTVCFSLLAALSVDILWRVSARVIQGLYASGEPYSSALIASFFRGFLVFPIIVFAILSLHDEYLFSRALSTRTKLLCVFCYASAGGLGGLMLASPGLERAVEGFMNAPAGRMALLVFIHALVLSFLPLLSLQSLLRFPRMSAASFLSLEFAPAIFCSMAALLTLLSGRLPAERVWLGGFLPGVVLNLLMFASARFVLKSYLEAK